MKALIRMVVTCFVAIGLTASLSSQSPSLTVHRPAILRQAPSTSSAVVAKLQPGDELISLSARASAGFYHVRTANGQEGWVYQTLVHHDEIDQDEPTATAGDVAATIDDAWLKPAPSGSILHGPSGFDPCPANGEAGGDTATNRLKNRVDVPTSYHPISFQALATLPFPDVATNRKKWTTDQIKDVARHEGVAVSLVGYLVAVKKQFGGGGESTNCHYSSEAFVDSHVALVDQRGQGEEKAMVVEPTPRFYPKHPSWVYSKLKALDDAPDPVRISGWTLMDPVHKGHLGKLSNNPLGDPSHH